MERLILARIAAFLARCLNGPDYGHIQMYTFDQILFKAILLCLLPLTQCDDIKLAKQTPLLRHTRILPLM